MPDEAPVITIVYDLIKRKFLPLRGMFFTIALIRRCTVMMHIVINTLLLCKLSSFKNDIWGESLQISLKHVFFTK